MEMGVITGGADEEPYIFLSQPEDFECAKCQAQAIYKDEMDKVW